MQSALFGVIGYGNMASAILKGAAARRVLSPQDVVVFDVNGDRLAEARQCGYVTAGDIGALAGRCGTVLLAVKPQNAAEVLDKLDGGASGRLLISIMAGVTKAKIHALCRDAAVCRCMPNTPALVSSGMTAIDDTELDEAQKRFVGRLFSAVGRCVSVRECDLNAVTALSGSGPAFVYYFIESLVKGAVEAGLPYDAAKLMAAATVEGAAKLALSSPENLGTLIDRVCSKGGTTERGMGVLRGSAFSEIVTSSVKSAYDRAEELSR